VINSLPDGTPFEVFLTSKDATASEWTTALSLMITARLRMGGTVDFIAKELQQIESLHDGTWINKRYYPSLPAYIGHLLEAHLAPRQATTPQGELTVEGRTVVHEDGTAVRADELVPGGMVTIAGPAGVGPLVMHYDGEECPQCHAHALIKTEGCRKCQNCTFSECG
jgi:ribonucleoside-diphosphate reductase alpha chain